MWYGQWETDKVIASYFDNRIKGRCVEVGAYDGVKGSNTKHFEDEGWASICIEPNPLVFSLLQKNRPKAFCELCACTNDGGVHELDVFTFESGIQSSLTSLKTDERLIRDYGDAIADRYQIKVRTKSLARIIEDWGWYWVDFISIDTEGTELDVLASLFNPWDGSSPCYPALLVVENNYEDANIEKYLVNFGYKKNQRYKVNDFYVRNDQNKFYTNRS